MRLLLRPYVRGLPVPLHLMKMRKTLKITVTAMSAAITLVLLYLASVMPSGRLAMTVCASLPAVAAVVESGIGGGLAVFAGSALLALILSPDKTAVLMFVLFFGWYPVIKSLIERLRRPVFEWIVKFLVFNAAVTVMWCLFRAALFEGQVWYKYGALAIYGAGNVIFAVYDMCISRIAGFYVTRISNHLKNR